MKNTRLLIVTALAAVLFLPVIAAEAPKAEAAPAVKAPDAKPILTATELLAKDRDEARAQVVTLQEQVASLQQAYRNLQNQRNEVAQQFLDAQLQVQLTSQQLQEALRKQAPAPKPAP